MLRGYKKKGKPALWTEAFPGPAPEEQKPKRIRSRSKSRTPEEREYAKLAKVAVAYAYLEGRRCPVVAAVPELREGRKYGHPISDKVTEVHHRYGRLHQLLCWTPGWLICSKQGHRWIHSNPARARELGFLCPAGFWNDYERAVWHLRKISENNP